VAFDMEKVAEAAAANGVAMEINAFPDRLDLSDVNARLARAKGCRFVIDTDAHAVGHLDLIRFGVFQARRAGLTKEDVWNTRRFAEFDRWRRSRGEHPAPKGATRPSRPGAASKPVPAKANAKPDPAPAGRARAGSGPAARPRGVGRTATAKPADRRRKRG
jgi:hypothetical protein